MDLLDFIPFRKELNKAYHGLTGNANQTSENPVFDELKVRRFSTPLKEAASLILDKIEHWVGWNLKSRKTSVGGMTMIRAEVSSFALLGTKIMVTFGLSEEIDRDGQPITTVNAKAETEIDSRGDLGESRRVIRMVLSALDFGFRKSHVRDDEYLFRSLDPKGQTQAMQELFDNTSFQTNPDEDRKKPAKQAIPFKSAAKSNGTNRKPSVSEKQKPASSPAAPSEKKNVSEEKPSRAKVKVIKLKK